MFSTSTYDQTIDIWNNKTAENNQFSALRITLFLSMTCTYFFKENLKDREVFITARLLYQIKILCGVKWFIAMIYYYLYIKVLKVTILYFKENMSS